MTELKPIIVDLDGTLIKSDTLFESVMALLKQNPLWVFLLPFWLLKGKAFLKNSIAAKVELDVELLPYNKDVMEYIRIANENGHACYLATGTVGKYARAIASYVGGFKDVFSTDENVNLTGNNKAQFLEKQFGHKGYIYLGNHHVDLPLWKSADIGVVVSGNKKLLAQAREVNQNIEHIPVKQVSIKTCLKAMRVHQWVKNALIFVPLLTSHHYFSPDLILKCILGFVAYSFAASSVYILNDLVDLNSDRQHSSKSKRPFAAGDISILSGLMLFPLLLLMAFILSSFLPLQFMGALVVYYLLTLAYSFKLKRIIMLDTILLAALYTMRIIAGTVLIEVPFSFWLLAFSMFIFLSLAFVKRYTELVSMVAEGNKKIAGRGYHAEDASIVSSLGGTSGYMAVLVFALYVNSNEIAELYSKPHILWLACPVLLYWISRVWIIAHRGNMHDDPIVFAVKDMQSLLTGICVFGIFMAAI